MSAVSARHLAVVGTGLIGTSAALAAARAGVGTITGWDPDAEFLAVAAERGAVEARSSVVDAVAEADLVVVAAPVGELPHAVREVLDRAPKGAR